MSEATDGAAGAGPTRAGRARGRSAGPPRSRTGAAGERAARAVEARTVRVAAAGVAVAVAVLVLVARDLAEWGWWVDIQAGPTPWATSLLVMGVFLVALQLVALLLVLEHQVDIAYGPSFWVGWVVIWLVRLAIIAAIVVVVLWADPDDGLSWLDLTRHRTWGDTADVLFWAEVGVTAALLAQRLAFPGLRAEPADTAGLDEVRTTTASPGRLAAIGASGGGIRAAAFVLGGHQATQDARDALGVAAPEHEPHVFAVSGGSYTASALALRRRYRPVRDGAEDPGPGDLGSWAESYASDSPELERLRRHTRYLYEPGGRFRDGLVTLVVGAAVNLFLLGVTVRFAVWLSTQLSVMLQVLRDPADLGDPPGYALHGHLVVVFGVPVVMVASILLLTLGSWVGAAVYDGGRASDAGADWWRRRATNLLGLSGAWRSRLLVVALAWLLLVLAVPGATAGLARAAVDNRPTATAAHVLLGLGLVDKDSCDRALVDDVEAAVEQAELRARLNPGERATVTAGACGAELDVVRTVDPDDGTPLEPARAIDPDEREAIAAYVASEPVDTPFQVGGIAVLLSVVAGLLRRASGERRPPGPSRFARVKARLVTWLPLAIMAVVLFYLSLLWTRGLLTRIDGAYLTTTVVLTVIACVVAFLVDANVTSLHRYYRSSIAGAFAVGLRQSPGGLTVAEELDPRFVYRFSELQARGAGDTVVGPRLHVVTTLNTQAAGESPTLRRGLPMVFAPDQVALHRGGRQSATTSTADYERFAGPGRVSIMATVGISGAAVSPLMGRFNEKSAPYRLLLALFNLRLGVWTRNPAHTPAASDPPRRRFHSVLWMTTKPGLAQMVLEAGGSSSADRRWVYLSDGGHLDNTALVECVRFAVSPAGRRLGGRVLVLDASNDAAGSWTAVGDAVAVVRADLGIALTRVSRPGAPPWMRLFGADGLEVLAVKAVRVEEPGHGVDSTWWDVLPPDVQSFLVDHPDFPRASTARQKFGDLEFEAYRALGYVAVSTSFAAVGWAPLTPAPP